VNYSNHPIYQRRRRVALLVIGILFLLVVLFLVRACGTGSEQTTEQQQEEEVVNAPTVEQTPRAVDEQTVSEGTQEDVTVEEKTKE
jgi:hypothetical protein